MTVITRTTFFNMSKPDMTKIPVVLENDEEAVEILPGPSKSTVARSSGVLCCMMVMGLLVLSAGMMTGLQVYRNYLSSNAPVRFCVTIPSAEDLNGDPELIEPHYTELLQWIPNHNIEVITSSITDGEDDESPILKPLQEEFEIGDNIEDIRVFNGGTGMPTSFIHDFKNNVSWIVDDDRCFTMVLNRALVVEPSRLVVAITAEEPWEVSRVHSPMRALLPPIRVARCQRRPVYALQPLGPTVVKRSTEQYPDAEYTHFAGRHVQEIDIHNIHDLLQYEKDNPQ